MRLQTIMAQRRARHTAELYAFARKLAGTADLYDVLWAAAHQIAAMLRADPVILLPEKEGRLMPQADYPPEDRLDEADLAAARWSFEHDQAAGRGAPTLPGAARLFLPMRTGCGAIGVVGLKRGDDIALLSPDERRLLDALMDQTALAVERTRLAEDIEEARLLSRTEKLRSTLLTSVSHDLRTPLASILGALRTLRAYGPLYDDQTRGSFWAPRTRRRSG
jgi:two-component system sensor histidine kinase KdpD